MKKFISIFMVIVMSLTMAGVSYAYPPCPPNPKMWIPGDPGPVP